MDSGLARQQQIADDLAGVDGMVLDALYMIGERLTMLEECMDKVCELLSAPRRRTPVRDAMGQIQSVMDELVRPESEY